MKKRVLFLFSIVVFALSGAAQNTIGNAFFEQVPYRGAFGTTGNWTAGWASWDPQNTVYSAPAITVSGEITSNTTWYSSSVYLLNGFVYVRDGATLTIEPGTVIRGDKASKGSLIIERGARLMAEGTADHPIVFTSNQAAGSRAYGDWGGVILCGKAAVNIPGGTAIIEGGPTSQYGGGASPDDNDNSGTLKFVRIEFPGVPYVPDKEINGLTLGAVGRNTVLDYIQVSYSGDDSFEWFGGTVNARHLIACRGWDDDFDTDNGCSGMVQFALSLRDSDIADPGSGSNSFESDNDASGSANTPLTAPVFSNVSVFGPKHTPTQQINSNYKRGLHLRRNTKLSVYNSVITGYPTGLFIDGSAAQANATAGSLNMQHCVLAGMGSFFAGSFERNYFLAPSAGNDTLADNSLLGVNDPYNFMQPDFLLKATSPLKSGSVWGTAGTGAREPLQDNALVYPNPASGQATLKFRTTSTVNTGITITDISGKVVQKIASGEYPAGMHESALDLSGLPKGIYIVRFSGETQNKPVKLIVR